MALTVIFNYRGASALINSTMSTELHTKEEKICTLVVSAIFVFLQQGVIEYEEFKRNVAFFSAFPSLELINNYLGNELSGFIWTEFPE